MNKKLFYPILGLVIILYSSLAFCQTKKTSIETSKDNTQEQLLQNKIYCAKEAQLEETAKLKFDPSTKKMMITQKIKNTDNEATLTLYYNDNQIILVEKRICDSSKREISFSIFSFDNKNRCLRNDLRDYKKNLSYANAIYWDTLTQHDIRCKVINLNKEKKVEIIQSTKASLDSIMQNFPQFKYSIDWK